MAKSIICGTLGHIDHGKTSLIKALNGFDGDETSEEKSRKITINLSFSNLKTQDTNIEFIDVPGHEKLVKTMIVGAYAFDYGILCVASDDGLMPQSKEHLQILSLLNVKNIIVCITKCDLTGKNRQNFVLLQTKNFIKNFSNLKIIKNFFISIKDKNSIIKLKEFLFKLNQIKKPKNEITRYYIDRIFNLKGVGGVVSGSLIEGEIKVKEKLFCLENGKFYLVKSAEIFSENVLIANSPNRVGLNLNSIKDLKIGQILSKKGFFRGFYQIDAIFNGEISHKSEVLFCIRSKQILAKALILADFGKEKFITFKFKSEVFLKFDEKFIVLQNSKLIGGGAVLNPVSEPLKKPLKIELLQNLNNHNFTKAFEILSNFHKTGFGLLQSFQRFGLNLKESIKIAQNLKDILIDEENFCIYKTEILVKLKNHIKQIISKNPNAIFSPHSLNLREKWASIWLFKIVLNDLVVDKILQYQNGLYFKINLNLENIKTNLKEKIFQELNLVMPNSPDKICEILQIDIKILRKILQDFQNDKKIIKVSEKIFITSEKLDFIMQEIRQILDNFDSVDIQIVKQKLQISRKFAIAYLEYLDNFKDIVNKNNIRKKAPNRG